MPQETMNKTPLEFAEPPAPQAPISVETYADELIDDIFQDVEQVLKGGSRLPREPVKPEFVSLKSIKVPQIILPPMPRPEGAEEEQKSQLRDASVEKQAPSLDRILLGVAFSSLFITLLLWLATKGGLGRLFAPEPVAVSPEPVLDAKTKADIQFADYVERSLKNIEQPNSGNIAGLPLLPPPPPAGTLPVLPVPGTPPVAASPDLNTSNLVQAINRVAEAIQDASNQTASLSAQVMNTLQSQNQNRPATPQTAVPGGRASGNVTAPAPTTAPTTPPQAQTESKPAATAPAPAPSTNETAVAPAPQGREIVPETEVPPPPPPAPAEAPPEQQAVVNPAPVTAHTLVGILELGDRSAALFEINGVARRIYVGESVGASGWTLVEVVNQEAVIRRNGEVRTIFVGQQF